MRMFVVFPEVLLTHGFCGITCKMYHSGRWLLWISGAQCKLFRVVCVCVWENNVVESGQRARSSEADTLCSLHRAASSTHTPSHQSAVTQHLLTARCQLPSRRQTTLTSSLTLDTNTHVPSCQTHTGQVQIWSLACWIFKKKRDELLFSTQCI